MRPLLSRVRRGSAGVTAITLIGIAIVLGPALAASPAVADTDDGRVTWATRPSNVTEPDGRAWVEQTLAPGASASDHLAVSNYSRERVTFRLSAADGYFTPTGRFNMLPLGDESTAAGTWISVADTVTVEPGATVVVPFTTTVPDNAEPGDHAAGIAASLLSQASGQTGTAVGVESRVGFRVMTRVTGELAPVASIDQLAGSYLAVWNPIRPGSAEISFDVVNSGNARFTVDGVVSVGGVSVPVQAADAQTQELLPGDRRTFHVTVDDVWPLFVQPADVRIEPTMITLDGSQHPMPAISASMALWTIPWSQLVIVLGLVLATISIIWRRLFTRRKMLAIVEAARAEGRREATSA